MENKQLAVAITGASGGIGRALARRFRRGGWLVVALCRTAPPDGVCDRFIPLDLTCAASLDSAIGQLKRDYPQLDCLVNNAGSGSYARWDELPEADLRHEFELDFFAPVRLTLALLPELLAARGGVIFTVSAAAFVPVACMGAYNAAKAALGMFAKTLAMETRGRKLRILAVYPGCIETGFSKHAAGGRQVPSTPGRNLTDPDALADAIYKSWLRRRRALVWPWWYRLAGIASHCFPGFAEKINRRYWKLGKES